LLIKVYTKLPLIPDSAMMNSRTNRVLAGLVLLIVVTGLAAASFPQAPVARGEYLVEQVAKCGECHTPRDGQGGWDEKQWLMGAPIWFRPVQPVTDWGYLAPRLAGLPNFTDEQIRAVLEKGTGPNGLPIRPPMHIYNMTPEDAGAIIAYLRAGKAR